MCVGCGVRRIRRILCRPLSFLLRCGTLLFLRSFSFRRIWFRLSYLPSLYHIVTERGRTSTVVEEKNRRIRPCNRRSIEFSIVVVALSPFPPPPSPQHRRRFCHRRPPVPSPRPCCCAVSVEVPRAKMPWWYRHCQVTDIKPPSGKPSSRGSKLEKLKRHEPAMAVPRRNNVLHYDQDLKRLTTVRELGRLQSFDDEFEFCGTQTQQIEGIGNAVPVRTATAVASAVLRCCGAVLTLRWL